MGVLADETVVEVVDVGPASPGPLEGQWILPSLAPDREVAVDITLRLSDETQTFRRTFRSAPAQSVDLETPPRIVGHEVNREEPLPPACSPIAVRDCYDEGPYATVSLDVETDAPYLLVVDGSPRGDAFWPTACGPVRLVVGASWEQDRPADHYPSCFAIQSVGLDGTLGAISESYCAHRAPTELDEHERDFGCASTRVESSRSPLAALLALAACAPVIIRRRAKRQGSP